ncbi:uncharacterized protein I206_102535 [Kwoniella pini CBS 10737]|uniref:Major facilitator superfamily (MFS) profile domain-containing protein n=1 Tax=Kwoniella pini CBS 10737 TaxID=1296096 RepID=A0A1B9I5L8_9TREE|nr:uncharacterized protein I206_02886 [Kwoniella pini CBS 10737]OCF50829.1 hypothetical protein I206_02886 [Kwoniella pini CBS 10737]
MVESKRIVKIVFFALILDLLAFTIPLPLFPRLTAWYLKLDSSSTSLLSQLLFLSRKWRSILLSYNGSESISDNGNKQWDIVLLGGLMGSLFSFCQCIISPWLGRLSDKYGRKKILLATMLGNILSAVIWIQSTSFASFLLSRLVGGLSEGNVQLSTAIISDVTTSSNRSRSLALVGIAFSICFTLGPSLGAYFASQPVPPSLYSSENKLNIYAVPALISLVLLVIETLYLAARLPETKGWSKPTEEATSTKEEPESSQAALTVEQKLTKLRNVGTLHGLFLLFFSGAEFTLTFLSYDLFSATNAENGRLLSYIGVLSALLQARHVRPSLTRLGELRLSSYGILACIIALSLLATLPYLTSSSVSSTTILYIAATCLSYTSATVVTGLTASAASLVDDSNPKLQRGKALGTFRSRGQLGRAIGPLLASSLYWVKGPTIAYSTLAGCLSLVYLLARSQATNTRKKIE